MSSTVAMLPNPANPYENDSYKVVVSTAVGFGIATAGLVLRLISRRLCRKRLEMNDWLIICAYVSIPLLPSLCLSNAVANY